MIAPENPYVLPSVVVGAAVYLGLSFLTDLSVLVRLGVLVGIVGVVPAVLNRAFGGSTDDPMPGAGTGETTNVTDDGTDVVDGTDAVDDPGVTDAAVDDIDAAAVNDIDDAAVNDADDAAVDDIDDAAPNDETTDGRTS